MVWLRHLFHGIFDGRIYDIILWAREKFIYNFFTRKVYGKPFFVMHKEILYVYYFQ